MLRNRKFQMTSEKFKAEFEIKLGYSQYQFWYFKISSLSLHKFILKVSSMQINKPIHNQIEGHNFDSMISGFLTPKNV